mmetsp:Transcript_76106/g.168558  ORF Transcript_76106/g.168558 Transcript_76106/m.168558 type:complete len:214 (-) Transcript_76106:178-819(-)
MAFRFTTTARRYIKRHEFSASARPTNARPSSRTARSMTRYSWPISSAAFDKIQPLALARRMSSPSRWTNSPAFCNAALVCLRLLATARCGGPSSSRMEPRTCPLACTALSTLLRQIINSSAACLQLFELLGTTSKTTSRLRCNSPAAERSSLPLSFTSFKASWKMRSTSITDAFASAPRSRASSKVTSVSARSLLRAGSRYGPRLNSSRASAQ